MAVTFSGFSDIESGLNAASAYAYSYARLAAAASVVVDAHHVDAAGDGSITFTIVPGGASPFATNTAYDVWCAPPTTPASRRR